MRKNIFLSFAAAGSILTAGEPVQGQQGVNNRVEETRKALIELIAVLPPEYTAAKGRGEAILGNLQDNDVSVQDEAAARDFADKLTQSAPRKAKAVLDALNGVETIVAQEEAAALNETVEERKIREEKEKETETLQKMIAKLNKDGLFDENAWGSTNSKGANCTIKVTRGTVSTEFINRQINGSNPKSTAFLKLGLLPGRNYTITIGKITGEASGIGIKLRDEKDQLSPLIRLNQGVNNITIPAGYQMEQILEIVNTTIAPTTTIEGITLDYRGEIGNQLADAK